MSDEFWVKLNYYHILPRNCIVLRGGRSKFCMATCFASYMNVDYAAEAEAEAEAVGGLGRPRRRRVSAVHAHAVWAGTLLSIFRGRREKMSTLTEYAGLL